MSQQAIDRIEALLETGEIDAAQYQEIKNLLPTLKDQRLAQGYGEAAFVSLTADALEQIGKDDAL